MKHALIGLATGAALVLGAQWIQPHGADSLVLPADAPASAGTDLAKLEPVLERIARALEQTRTRSQTRSGPERVEVASPAAAQVGPRAGAVEHASLHRRAATMAAPVITEWRERGTRVEEVREFLDHLENDRKAARRRIMLRTPEEILALFGFPTGISLTQAGNAYWSYNTETSGFSVIFVDGRAIFD